MLPEPPIEKASLVAQVVKNLLAMQETWVGKIARRREWLPHQYSCLENSMDRGAWRAIVHVVTKVGHNREINTFSYKIKINVSIF